MKTIHALYVSGYVDEAGNIYDPIFIREIELIPDESEIPRNCFVVTEIFDGRYWSSESEDVYSSRIDGWKKGDFCTASYFNTGGKVDDFLCELTGNVSSRQDHVSGKLYTYKGKYLFHPKDICVQDISDVY